MPWVCRRAARDRAHPSALTGAGGATRTYDIAADEVVWDYAPSGTNLAEGRAFNDNEIPWMVAGPHVTGRLAKKALYREYTDATFTTLKPRPPEDEHTVFLKTIIPSRKATKQYLGEESDDHEA